MLSQKQFEELKGRLEEAFSDYYEKAGGKNFRYHHLLRVRTYALELMEIEELEDEEFDSTVVEVSAMFHDIGRSRDIEDGYLDPMEKHEGHDRQGEQIIDEFIADVVDSEQLEKIRTIIGNHHSEPETIEGKIVQDADRLAKFGVLNIWRLVHYASDEKRDLESTLDYFWNTAVKNSEDKMDSLHFNKSREVAEERLENYRQTIKRMEREHHGDDIR